MNIFPKFNILGLVLISQVLVMYVSIKKLFTGKFVAAFYGV